MKKLVLSVLGVVAMISMSSSALAQGRDGVSGGLRGEEVKTLRGNTGGALRGAERAEKARDPANRPMRVGKPLAPTQ